MINKFELLSIININQNCSITNKSDEWNKYRTGKDYESELREQMQVLN